MWLCQSALEIGRNVLRVMFNQGKRVGKEQCAVADANARRLSKQLTVNHLAIVDVGQAIRAIALALAENKGAFWHALQHAACNFLRHVWTEPWLLLKKLELLENAWAHRLHLRPCLFGGLESDRKKIAFCCAAVVLNEILDGGEAYVRCVEEQALVVQVDGQCVDRIVAAQRKGEAVRSLVDDKLAIPLGTQNHLDALFSELWAVPRRPDLCRVALRAVRRTLVLKRDELSGSRQIGSIDAWATVCLGGSDRSRRTTKAALRLGGACTSRVDVVNVPRAKGRECMLVLQRLFISSTAESLKINLLDLFWLRPVFTAPHCVFSGSSRQVFLRESQKTPPPASWTAACTQISPADCW
eukprot:m.39951 g.39951  ORF g.39951 m.39951 type:complete len:355 (+) comp5969_c0_seq2:3589-4653(+)